MKPGGGFVAGASHDSILEETPLENVVAMFDAIQEYGEYWVIILKDNPQMTQIYTDYFFGFITECS